MTQETLRARQVERLEATAERTGLPLPASQGERERLATEWRAWCREWWRLPRGRWGVQVSAEERLLGEYEALFVALYV